LNNVKKALDGQLKPEELRVDEKDIYNKIVADKENPGQDPGNWMYATAYLVGAGALESPMNKVSGVFYGQTPSMALKWPALQKMEQETFTKIIMGKAPLDSFDSFVAEWKKSGGDEIIQEIEEVIRK